MNNIYPLYCDSFKCIAGNCPDTCCAGWEIVIDEKFEKIYRSHHSKAAKDATAAMYTDSDGDTCLRLKDGRCPMLTDDNLCRLYIDMGKDALCDVCRIYPRFNKDTEGAEFSGISLSCPEAARLILSDETFGELNQKPEMKHDKDKLIFDVYETFRSICKNGDILFSLPLAEKIQDEMDFGDYLQAQKIMKCSPHSFEKNVKSAHKVLEDVKLLQSLDILNNRWNTTLAKLSGHLDKAAGSEEYNKKRMMAILEICRLKEIKNIAIYYLYKYLPEAMEYADVYGNVHTAVKCLEILCELCAMQKLCSTMPKFSHILEFAKDFSREVEHNGDNLERFTE